MKVCLSCITAQRLLIVSKASKKRASKIMPVKTITASVM